MMIKKTLLVLLLSGCTTVSFPQSYDLSCADIVQEVDRRAQSLEHKRIVRDVAGATSVAGCLLGACVVAVPAYLLYNAAFPVEDARLFELIHIGYANKCLGDE